MPTKTGDGRARAPKPVAPVQPPDARAPVKPPTGKPVPVLASHGFHGSIHDFNERVEKFSQSYQRIHAARPSPGLVFDVARSKVPDHLFDTILSVPTSPLAAKAAGLVARARKDEDFFVRRPDGLMEIDTPLTRMIRSVPVEPERQLSYGELQKTHPWVAGGFLPIKNIGQVVQAVRELQRNPNAQVLHDGKTVEQFDKEMALAAGVGGSAALKVRELGLKSEPLRAVETIKQAQVELNKLMGTKLPVTGFINEDWSQALSNWQKSSAYFRSSTEFLAHEHGMSVPDFARAWRNKQRKAQDNALAAHFVEAMPLQLFSHPNSLWGNTGDLGSYLKGHSNNPLDIALHGLSRSAGLTLNMVGGTLDSVKADTAAAHAFASEMQKQGDYDKAVAKARKTLHENPTWLRALYPDLDENPKGIVRTIDQITNLAGDLLILRKPTLTGETVAYGDLAAASRSTYVHHSSAQAYKYLKAGKLNRAASMMEGGAGAEKLAAASEAFVKNGEMSFGRFKQHLAELYANGETTLVVKGKDVTVRGPVLDSLRTQRLPTPGYSGQGWRMIHHAVRDAADNIDHWLLKGERFAPAHAVTFTRAMFSHVVHQGAHGYFDPRLPERIHDWALATFKDAKLANKWETDFVRARAHEHVPRMQKVFEDMQARYHIEYPVGTKAETPEPFEALLGTEAPAVATFPSGGGREAQNFMQRASESAKTLDRHLNTVARQHAQIIISGFPIPLVGGRSLFYKHMFADTSRRIVGGGFQTQKLPKKEFDAFLKANPDYERKVGSFLSRVKQGETRWLLNRGEAINRTNFRTGEYFNARGTYMEQAGGYVRRLITDDGVGAYLASSKSNLEPLVQLVLNNKTYRGLWKAAKKGEPNGLSAEEYAAKLYDRFNEFHVAAREAGIKQPFDEAQGILAAHRGAEADKALGQWVKGNRIDLEIKGARPEHVGLWDDYMGTYINHLMIFNKWNRGEFGKNVMLQHWKDAKAAGFEDKAAADVAMSVAEKQAVYHMLDFANRLKIEQDLRWLSYFATKHRLYWKWVMGTMVRRPDIAAVVHDFQQNLDERGNINFSLFGHDFSIPAARLMWVPGKEYSEYSPLATAGIAAVGALGSGESVAAAFTAAANSAAGTNGNILTRSDQGLSLFVHAARTFGGGKPATYGGASKGMTEQTKRRFNRQVNEYQLDYFAEHGHYAPETEVVKHVLWRMTAEELWRANLPLPVIPRSADRNEQQRMLDTFMAINDPAKRRAYLEKHPDLSEHFGVSQDPQVFLRNREYFSRYAANLDVYRDARQKLFQRAVAEGFTPALMREKRALDKAFQDQFNDMLVADAKDSGIDVPKGQIPDGKTIPFGKWGKVIEADPLINPSKVLKDTFPNLKQQEYGKVVGAIQKQLQYELRLLGDPEYAGTFDDEYEVKSRKRQILAQLEAFRSYPKDALGRLQLDYQTKHVNPYWTEYERRYQQIRNAPRTEQTLLKAQFYAWREKQDEPVVLIANGKKIKFPSPTRMAWATLDPQTREERLSRLVSANWDHLTDYEKELLGAPAKARVAKGYLILEQAKKAYRDEYPGAQIQSDQILALVKQVDREAVPGFLKDYLFSKQPLIRRFENMHVYQEMPREDRAKFEQYVAKNAREVARGMKDGGYDSNELRAVWVKYIDEQVLPWLSEPAQASLRKRIALLGPDFLHSLVSP